MKHDSLTPVPVVLWPTTPVELVLTPESPAPEVLVPKTAESLTADAVIAWPNPAVVAATADPPLAALKMRKLPATPLPCVETSIVVWTFAALVLLIDAADPFAPVADTRREIPSPLPETLAA